MYVALETTAEAHFCRSWLASEEAR
ncbi:hypothetical protein EMIT0P218_120078 [Pseudomonas sp. IT-P218]